MGNWGKALGKQYVILCTYLPAKKVANCGVHRHTIADTF